MTEAELIKEVRHLRGLRYRGQVALLKRLAAPICDATGVTEDEMFTMARASKDVALARWIVWRRARQEGLSYPQIAKVFGLDHTTVMHGVRKIEGMLE